MHNRFLCLFLTLVLALPLVLGACSNQVLDTQEPAPVYTLYCITGDTTTDTAITQVEYELNRTLFYRIGSIVKLELVTADEYHDLIESKTIEINDYINGTNISGKNEKEEKQSLVNTAKLSESAKSEGYEFMTGEAILNDLEAGIEIELECPRLDLFLITDYEAYLEMAENGDLAALDTVLSNEAKAIKSYVHSSFFNAAKVGNKTYGVPCNTTIGQYTYVVFDKEVLESSGVAQVTLKDLDDLSEYLEIVKSNNPDVIPLANTVTPYQFSYMFNDGFPAYVTETGHVRPTYTDEDINEYFSLLTKYYSLGYFENASGETGDNENARFAVKFISGTKDEMEALAEKNGYVYNQYSVPVATSENSIDCIYAVSNLCPTSWQTEVMEILTELYVDEGLQNTFLYGLENEHYRLEGSQVVRLNKDYMMSYSHTGNCFIAYTDKDAGDAVNKWEEARNQNIDATESKTIGYTFTPLEFIFGTLVDENGVETEWGVTEPNYEEILWNIVQPHYEKLVTGTAVTFDYTAEYTAAEQAALDSIYNDLFDTYKLRLEQSYTSNLQNEIIAEYSEQFRADALETTKEELVGQFNTSSRKKKLREKLAEENPDASEEEIEQMQQDLLEDKDALWEYRTLVRKEAQWETAIEANYESLISETLEQKTEEVLNSDQYLAELEAISTSAEFVEEYNYRVEIEVADTVNSNIDKAISGLISTYCESVIAECEVALKESIDAFAAEYAEASQKAYEDGVYAQLKQLYKGIDESELQKRTQEQLDFIKTYAEADDLKLENAIYDQIAKYFPEITDETALKEKYNELTKIFEEVYLPLYEDAYNGTTLALVEIGYASKTALKEFGTVTEEETTEGETSGETSEDPEAGTGTEEEPDEDTPVAGEYTTYFEFVISAKFQAPYYAQFGTPA